MVTSVWSALLDSSISVASAPTTAGRSSSSTSEVAEAAAAVAAEAEAPLRCAAEELWAAATAIRAAKQLCSRGPTMHVTCDTELKIQSLRHDVGWHSLDIWC